MQVRRRSAPLLVALAMTAACGGGGADEAGPDERAAATPTSEQPSSTSSGLIPSTTTTAPVDPTVVPDDPAAIDEAYVEAVLREHNRVIGDALRLQLQGADLKEIVDRYNAIYVPEVADGLLSNIIALDEPTIRTLRKPLGDQVSRVIKVTSAASTCIEATVSQDYTEVLAEPPPPARNLVVLRQKDSAPAETPLNITPWLSEGYVPEDAGAELTC